MTFKLYFFRLGIMDMDTESTGTFCIEKLAQDVESTGAGPILKALDEHERALLRLAIDKEKKEENERS